MLPYPGALQQNAPLDAAARPDPNAAAQHRTVRQQGASCHLRIPANVAGGNQRRLRGYLGVMLHKNAIPLHRQGLKGALPCQHIPLGLYIGPKVPNITPIAFCDMTHDGHVCRQHLGKKIHAEIVGLILGDHFHRFRGEQIDPRIGQVAKHLGKLGLL